MPPGGRCPTDLGSFSNLLICCPTCSASPSAMNEVITTSAFGFAGTPCEGRVLPVWGFNSMAGVP